MDTNKITIKHTGNVKKVFQPQILDNGKPPILDDGYLLNDRLTDVIELQPQKKNAVPSFRKKVLTKYII
jgi:hypothetical protein